jgi:hypothetical protein
LIYLQLSDDDGDLDPDLAKLVLNFIYEDMYTVPLDDLALSLEVLDFLSLKKQK